MTDTNKISTTKLILVGYLMVNIPVIAVILVAFSLILQTNINHTLSFLIGVAIGWLYWQLATTIWIKWALKRKVDPKRLHKIGVLSLLLWKYDIARVEKIATLLKTKT